MDIRARWARLWQRLPWLQGIRGQGSQAASRATPQVHANVAALTARLGVGPDTPGLAVLVRDKEGVLFEGSYGLASLATQATITSTTLFDLASVSKTMTATALLLLHDRGLLSIDDDASRYLPEISSYCTKTPIRIVDLLQHTSGLPDYMEFEDVASANQGFHSNADYLAEFAKGPTQRPIVFGVGKKHDYNDTNYLLLASIIERVSQKPFAEFMHDEIFTAAGMVHTFVFDSPAAWQRARPTTSALGYERKVGKKPWREAWGLPPGRHETMLAVGDGGVWSTLADMGRWDEALRKGQFVSPATWNRVLQRSLTRDGEHNDYGLGFVLDFVDPSTLAGYGHDGLWGGFCATYHRNLSNDQTTIILSNRDDFFSDDFGEGLSTILNA